MCAPLAVKLSLYVSYVSNGGQGAMYILCERPCIMHLKKFAYIDGECIGIQCYCCEPKLARISGGYLVVIANVREA